MKHYVKISPIEKKTEIFNEVKIIRFKFELPFIDHFFITEKLYLSLKEKHNFPILFDIKTNRDDIFKFLNLEEYCNY
jgi:hypothetical protein